MVQILLLLAEYYDQKFKDLKTLEKINEQFLKQMVLILRNCLSDTDLAIEPALAKEWKAFSIDSPFTNSCAEFAKKNPKIVGNL